jgi:hypothetical protein
VATVGSEAELKINQSLQAAVDVMKGQAVPRIACMRCETVEATVGCAECNSKFCSKCSDIVHVGKLKLHRLTYDAAAVHGAGRAPFCSQPGHEEYRTDLFCADCKVMLCVVCSQVSVLHRTHVVVPLSEAADVEKVRLKQTLIAAKKFRAELKHALEKVDHAMENNLQSSEQEIAAFDRSIQLLVQKLQERRAALVESAKMMAEVELNKLRMARDQIVQLAAALNDASASSERALALGTHTAIIKGCVDMEAQLAKTDPILIADAYVPQFSFPHYQHILTGVESITVALSPQADIPGHVVEASHIFSKKGFVFSQSTYNELKISNRGCTVESAAGSGWETAMCDTLLSAGTTYYEVSVDQYTPFNGHNIIIGLVFDGAYELCEVIGEDTHSIGFDVGRGTKCVGGDYFLPYADESCKAGDVVGVKVDFTQGTVTFYRNGESMGVAFTGLARPCYAAVSLVNRQRVTLMFPLKTPL